MKARRRRDTTHQNWRAEILNKVGSPQPFLFERKVGQVREFRGEGVPGENLGEDGSSARDLCEGDLLPSGLGDHDVHGHLCPVAHGSIDHSGRPLLALGDGSESGVLHLGDFREWGGYC